MYTVYTNPYCIIIHKTFQYLDRYYINARSQRLWEACIADLPCSVSGAGCWVQFFHVPHVFHCFSLPFLALVIKWYKVCAWTRVTPALDLRWHCWREDHSQQSLMVCSRQSPNLPAPALPAPGTRLVLAAWSIMKYHEGLGFVLDFVQWC